MSYGRKRGQTLTLTINLLPRSARCSWRASLRLPPRRARLPNSAASCRSAAAPTSPPLPHAARTARAAPSRASLRLPPRCARLPLGLGLEGCFESRAASCCSAAAPGSPPLPPLPPLPPAARAARAAPLRASPPPPPRYAPPPARVRVRESLRGVARAWDRRFRCCCRRGRRRRRTNPN